MKETKNEMLSAVGGGTPAGELLRRYCHPVCVASELTDQQRYPALLSEILSHFSCRPAPGKKWEAAWV
jgi:hypothetical protein